MLPLFSACRPSLSPPPLAPAFLRRWLRHVEGQGNPTLGLWQRHQLGGQTRPWRGAVLRGQPAVHSYILLGGARVVLDLILGHAATGPKHPVDARDFAGHPEGIKLNRTLFLPPRECYSPLRG